MQLKIMRLNEKAILPRYATGGAACFDLCTTEGGIIEPGQSAAFGTGWAAEIPAGYVMQLYSRSGHGFKNSVSLSNSVGVIGSDYRGEIKVKLINHGNEPFEVKEGDRVVQAMLIPLPEVELVVASELSDTNRGAGGFGSTGS